MKNVGKTMYQSDKLTDEQKLSQLMDGEWQGLNPADCVATVCADEALRAKWARYHIIRDVLNNEPVEASQALTSRICAAIADEPSYSNITPFSGMSTPDAGPLQNDVAESESAEYSARPATAAVTAITESVSAASDPQSRKQPVWFGSAVGGFALAASVALVTVVGVNLFEQQSAPDVSTVASVESSVPGEVVGNAAFVQGDTTTLPVVEFVANTGAYWVSPESSERVIDEERLNMMLSQHIENSPTSSRSGLLPYSGLVGYEEIGLGR